LFIAFTLRCFNTQPREGGCCRKPRARNPVERVSTHSRAKAAALETHKKTKKFRSFNTQPREGGCPTNYKTMPTVRQFQHTAARRRLRHYFY